MASAVAYESIQVRRDGEITTITMNRPDKRNALSTGMMRELLAAFQAAGRDRDTRVVILAANGPAFSAGHDLSELVDGDINAYRAVFDLCTELMTAIQSIPQPVIARGPQDRHCGGLPARRHLRSRRGRRGGALCHTRASRSACFAPPRWSRSAARSDASARSKCC